MSARLGVDLGTTWTAAALSEGAHVVPVKLGASGSSMPSVVAIADGKPVAGDAAVRVGRDQPTAVAREFKRRLGDSTPIVLAGTPYGPEALTGHLLAHVVAVAGAAGAVGGVTLSHPATWGEFKLDLLREAGRVAGVTDLELIAEPVAAAGHYARLGRVSAGEAVAVYDFGGGTFDAAVVRVGDGGPELLGRAEGLDRLGGLDLDQAVMAHVNAAVDGALGAMDRDNPDVRRAALELRNDCVAAKEALSADTDTTIPVRFPGLNTEIRLTRAEFESAVRPRVAETLDALDRAIASAGLKSGDLAGIVLVGGTSRIPLIVEQVSVHTGRPVLVDADPKLSVAFGAAEPNLRPAQAAATREAAMSDTSSDTSRSTPTPPPPPGAKAAEEAGAGAGPGTPPKPPGAPGATGARPGAPKPSERRTSATNAPKEQSGLSTAGKVAAGVAAAGAATAAGVLWHEDVTDALGFGDDEAAPDDTAAEDAAAAPDDSMDAFDAVAPAAGGAAAGGFGGGGGGGGFGGGGGGAFAPPRPPRQEAPDLPPPMAGAPQAAPMDPSFTSARDQLRDRLQDWTAPEGANPEEAAELRARLEGLIDRYQPRPGQSIDDAIAELRDEFALRIDNFTQDVRLDAVVDAQDGGVTPTIDSAFEAQRQVLVDRLANWTPPDGTSPERAAELRAELQQMVDRYRPLPGQPVDEAVAELQDRFESKVEDFEQDAKIEVLIGEETAEESGAGEPATDPVSGDPMSTDPAATDPAAPGTEVDPVAGTDDPGPYDGIPDPEVSLPAPTAVTATGAAAGVAGTAMLDDDFDGMVMAESAAAAAGSAAGDLMTAPPAAAADADMDVLGEAQVASAVGVAAPVPEMAPVGVDAGTDVLGLDGPVGPADTDFDTSAFSVDSEPQVTFEPEFEPASTDFDEPDIEPDMSETSDDATDDATS